MPRQKSAECPEILATLIEVCNALPEPYIWPHDYEVPEGGERDWSIPKRPLEARLIHPQVITAEVKYSFNVEFAYHRDAAWAAEFEQAFFERAGSFTFVKSSSVLDNDSDTAGRLFGKFLVKHGRKARREMEQSLDPHMIEVPLYPHRNPPVPDSHTEVSYRLLLQDRITRLGLPDILNQYLNGEIKPFTKKGKGEYDDDLEYHAKRRWFDLWNAFYNLSGIAQIDLEPRAGQVMIDTGTPRRIRYVDLYVDNEGIIRLGMDDLLLRILTRYDIPAGRVKMCKECNKFFWAKRSDQNCCGKKCTNAYHVRQFRRGQKGFTISALAQKINVQPHVLSYWESEFPMLAARRTRNGQRLYSAQDAAVAKEIKELLYDKQMTIASAKAEMIERASFRYVEDLGLGADISIALRGVRISLVHELTKYTEQELWDTGALSKDAFAAVKEALAVMGVRLRDSPYELQSRVGGMLDQTDPNATTRDRWVELAGQVNWTPPEVEIEPLPEPKSKTA